MASIYELGYLCDYVYWSEGKKIKSFIIPFTNNEICDPRMANRWQLEAEFSYSPLKLYCATFKKLTGSQDTVHVFRGTTDSLFSLKWKGMIPYIDIDALERDNQWRNTNLKHLSDRKSEFILKAIDYLRRVYKYRPNEIITGHSLGGFTAQTMAWYFKGTRIASFNAPRIVFGTNQFKTQRQKDCFKSAKIKVFESLYDGASIATAWISTVLKFARFMQMSEHTLTYPSFYSQKYEKSYIDEYKKLSNPTNRLRGDNVEYYWTIRDGSTHSMSDMYQHFQENPEYQKEIIW